MSTLSSISPSPGASSAARKAARPGAPLAALALAALCAAAGAGGCAGALEDPARFVYLLEDAGKPADAGPPDAGPPADAGPDAGADAGSDGGAGGSGCDPVTAFFGPSCATGACHSADRQQGDLDLASPGMPGRLIGRSVNGYPGLLIIDPTNPDNSLLYTKVTSNPPGNGFQMPLGADPLSDLQVACLLDWVRSAATNP
jgi:hypothetical protein